MTITEFLQARLDETEAAAKAATEVDGQWFTPGPGAGEWAVRQNKAIVDCPAGIVVFDEGCPTDEQAAHIASHDPARVLRQVEAGRKILAMYIEAEKNRPQGYYGYEEGEMRGEADALLLAVKALAEAWSDHPDYWSEWG